MPFATYSLQLSHGTTFHLESVRLGKKESIDQDYYLNEKNKAYPSLINTLKELKAVSTIITISTGIDNSLFITNIIPFSNIEPVIYRIPPNKDGTSVLHIYTKDYITIMEHNQKSIQSTDKQHWWEGRSIIFHSFYSMNRYC